jgi:hypothetical protein
MDQTILVKNDRDIGAEVLEALSRVKLPVTLGEWIYVPELQEWHMILATPWYDTKGLRTAYSALVDALQSAGIYERVPMRRVIIKSPSDPVVKALQQEVKEQKQGTAYVLRHGDKYSVIFPAAFSLAGTGGPVPVVRFSNPDDLRTFLAREMHLRASLVEDALDDVIHSGAASIYPVALTTRDVKRLGLA